MALFGIKEHINFNLKLIDNCGAQVDAGLFRDVVAAFHKSGGFYLELIYNVDFKTGPKIVTPTVR